MMSSTDLFYHEVIIFLPILHRFPFSAPDVLNTWVVNMKRDKWKPSKHAVLCSEHFSSDCFDKTGLTVRLREDAVPTIFRFPDHLQKVHFQDKLLFFELLFLLKFS